MTVQMDHAVDAEVEKIIFMKIETKIMTIVKVEKLFKRIQQEQAGKLDLLVNNAYAGVGLETFKFKFENQTNE